MFANLIFDPCFFDFKFDSVVYHLCIDLFYFICLTVDAEVEVKQENSPSMSQSSVAKFKPSKWETVDPEVVEAQGNLLETFSLSPIKN